MTIATKITKFLPNLKSIIRIMLFFGITVMICSCALLLAYGKMNSINFDEAAFTFAWYSIFATLYISIITAFVLPIILIHNKVTKLPVWNAVKTEIIMFVAAIALMLFMD